MFVMLEESVVHCEKKDGGDGRTVNGYVDMDLYLYA